ncbi:serine/threonine-protein kinase [Arthrobacter sp. LjRoot14]|uniref:serine/threonine-protein kinase n=1 Tax=Arthrobacter sp. LjRoot14 TaxID=3342265 RepID=UPI003ECE88C2
MSTKRPVAPPPAIPGFTYVSLLGSGGFSDVYLYEQDRPRRKVAVKVLLSDLKTEGARRRFESEANLMAQLSSHPYIVTIFEAEVTEDGHSYLAMEYCSRPSLDVRYRRQRFSVDEVLAVGIQVASAVETAHRAGIAHRDIKPANILVTDYNRPALTDFGISGTLGSDTDEDAGMSIPWSPPEQFRDGPVDGVMVDVWALGATLYTLLAGRSPFVLPGADNSQRELISRITNSPVPRLGRADVPESLELALATAMAKSAASRYSSAHAFALALQRIQAELNLSVTPFEVLEEAHGEEQHPDDGFEETRVRSIASVDPDQTGNAPTFPARTRPAAFTPVVPAAPPAGPAPGPVPGPGARPDQHDDWSQGTMLRGSVASGLRPGAGRDAADDATVHRGAPGRPAGWQGAPAGRNDRGEEHVAATVNRPQALQEATAEDPADHSKRNLWLAVAGGAVLVVAVVVGLVLGASRPEPVVEPTGQVSKPPADAIGDGTVPDVTNIKAVTEAGKVRFTWTNPQPKPGDTYKWQLTNYGQEEGPFQSSKEAQAEVAYGKADFFCIKVMIVRSDGSASPMTSRDAYSCMPS